MVPVCLVLVPAATRRRDRKLARRVARADTPEIRLIELAGLAHPVLATQPHLDRTYREEKSRTITSS
ncbi:hypothetical protein VTJ49DRAFT_5406 [Mycothermus thermophilus]|uniref:Uncharacterized protein n=1 Tax=Humicola insolens TaxID=85995 RepID=A0ABR3V365_HUMIN